MSADPGFLELDLAAGGLRLLLDGVELDGATGQVTLARIAAAPQPIGPAIDVGAAFRGPAGIAVDAAGDVFVADPAGHRIVRIATCETDGAAVGCIRGPGAAPGLVDAPRGVTIDARGRLVVADTRNDRLQAFDLPTLQLLLVVDGIDEPWELAADGAGGLYVVEHGTATVRKFDVDGNEQPAFAAALAAEPPNDPVSIAVVVIDGTEQVVVVEGGANGRLLVYGRDGTYDVARSAAWSDAVRTAVAGAAGAVAVTGDRLYVAERATGRVLAFALDGRLLGRSPAGAGATALAIDPQGRLLVHPGDGAALRLDAGVAASGSVRAGPIVAGDDPAAWQRVRVAASVPAGAHVRLFTLTSDAPASDPPPLPVDALSAGAEPTPLGEWRAGPPDALDLLALNAAGRCLWVGARLDAGSGGSPAVGPLHVEHDRPGWLGLLPATYARDDASRAFLVRLLALTESVLDDEEALLDDLPRHLGAAGAPAAWLDWLAGWLAFDLDERWSEATRRAAVAGAFGLNGRRGTAAGLRDLVRVMLGIDVRVREPAGDVWALGGDGAELGTTTMLAAAPAQGAVLATTAIAGGSDLIDDDELGRPLFEPLASRFCVEVRAADVAAPGALDALRALVDRERPAETVAHVRVIEPRARVGLQAQLGVDAIVGGGPPKPLRLTQ